MANAVKKNTTTPVRNLQGIRLPDGSKLVGVLYNSDMVTVLGFAIETKKGTLELNSVGDFSHKVRITDYVDSYGRCNPKRFRDFQQRTGMTLPYSKMYNYAKTGVEIKDPKNITTERLNALVGAGNCFIDMPDYAYVKGLIRRASNQADAAQGKVVNGEGIVGLEMVLHFPPYDRKKRVKDASGNIKLVPFKTAESELTRSLQVYDAYSLPFEVKKYAIKRTPSKTAVNSTMPLYNYYVSIKKDGLPEFKGTGTPTDKEKGTLLLPKEKNVDYNPGFDTSLVEALVLTTDDMDMFRKNGVYIKGAGAASPRTNLKSDVTVKDLFDVFEDVTDDTVDNKAVAAALSDEPTAETTTEETVVEETVIEEPVADESVAEEPEIAGDAPEEIPSEETLGVEDSSDVGVEALSEDDVRALFKDVKFVGRVGVENGKDLTSPTDAGVTLPEEVLSYTMDVNNLKVLAAARAEWDDLCRVLEEVANAICEGVGYSYDGADRQLPLPKSFAGKDNLIYEDKAARRATIMFGDTKKGSKYPMLTLNSINVKISRKFYADFFTGVTQVPVTTKLSHDTITLYAFDGKPKGSKGFSMTLPSGLKVDATYIHERLAKVSKLMHALGNDFVQSPLALSFINAGLAATWRQSLKEARRAQGLNSTAVAQSESMEKKVNDIVYAKFPKAQADQLVGLALDVAFGRNKVDNFVRGSVPYDPVTGEYRGGYHSTTTEKQLADNVVRAIADMEAEDNGTADYKASSSKQVQSFIAQIRAKEGGTPWDANARVDALSVIAAKAGIEDLKTKTNVTADFNWDGNGGKGAYAWESYEALKAEAIKHNALKKVGKAVEEDKGPKSSDYALSFDMRLSDSDIESMKVAGVDVSTEDPMNVKAQSSLDSNVKEMVLFLLATVGVGETTNSGLTFVGGDENMLGLWTDKSKAPRANAATRTYTYEFAAVTKSGQTYSFGASLKKPTTE